MHRRAASPGRTRHRRDIAEPRCSRLLTAAPCRPRARALLAGSGEVWAGLGGGQGTRSPARGPCRGGEGERFVWTRPRRVGKKPCCADRPGSPAGHSGGRQGARATRWTPQQQNLTTERQPKAACSAGRPWAGAVLRGLAVTSALRTGGRSAGSEPASYPCSLRRPPGTDRRAGTARRGPTAGHSRPLLWRGGAAATPTAGSVVATLTELHESAGAERARHGNPVFTNEGPERSQGSSGPARSSHSLRTRQLAGVLGPVYRRANQGPAAVGSCPGPSSWEGGPDRPPDPGCRAR